MLSVRSPTADDRPSIELLLREPMAGSIRFAMHPTSGQASPGAEERIVVHSKQRTLIGYAARTVHDVWLEGRAVRVGYLHSMRLSPHSCLPRRAMQRTFDELMMAHDDSPLPAMYTSIMAGNARARRLLERGLPGLPKYDACAALTTLVMRTPKRAHAPTTSPLPIDEACAILQRHDQSWAFRPVWTTDRLTSANIAPSGVYKTGVVRACAGLWDRRAEQVIRIANFTMPLWAIRPLINLFALYSGRPALPAPGPPVRLGFVSPFSCDAEDAESCVAVLRAVQASAAGRGITHLALGMPVQHPLLTVIRAAFKPFELRSTMYTVRRPDAVSPPMIVRSWPEIALL
jgi:hypothetical protein